MYLLLKNITPTYPYLLNRRTIAGLKVVSGIKNRLPLLTPAYPQI